MLNYIKKYKKKLIISLKILYNKIYNPKIFKMLSHKRLYSKNEKSETFLLKLYEILKTKSYYQYINWSEDGKSIVIKDITGLTKKVLPKFYKHHNFASFVRQLNMYNFHKIRSTSSSNEQIFQHEKFVKDITIDDVKNIKRKIHENINCVNNLNNEIISNNINEENLNKYINCIQNDNNNSNISNNVIDNENNNINLNKNVQLVLSYLLKKTNENHSTQNLLKKQIEMLTQQNNILMSKIENNNQQIISQNNFYKKMKGIALFFMTLIMRVPQVNNNNTFNIQYQNFNSKNHFKNLIYKYIDFHYNKKNLNNKNILSNDNMKINSIKESPTQTENENEKNNIVEKNETFSINNTNTNSNESTILINLKDNLSSKKINESLCDDLSLSSFPSHNFFDIDLNLNKNNSSFNLFNANNNFSN